jgi:CRISPR-associated protein Cmx8
MTHSAVFSWSKAMPKKKTAPKIDVLELAYALAELPSSQHRAGLAGLVLMVQWLKRQGTHTGICDITHLDERGATLLINQEGLAALFDEVYGASNEEQERSQLLKDKRKGIIPPLREVIRTEIEPKTGKEKSKTMYVYPVVIPKGAFLVDADPSASGDKGMWIKLWRDVIWSIFRGVPATRKPFEDRADKVPPKDVAAVWADLCQPSDYPIELPSTYFIGAQAVNAENVPFKDRARLQLLLHFWPYIAQVYVPEVYDSQKGERKLAASFALAIPDVADLELFCEEFPHVLHARGVELSGYRPREAVVDVAVESALDMLQRLRERLPVSAHLQELVLGVDVVHVEKQGNSIKTLGVTRLDPELRMIDDYPRLKTSLWHPLFRQQRLLNLVNGRVWYAGFQRLLCRVPYEQSIGHPMFRHDARESFRQEVQRLTEEASREMADATFPETPEQCETLVYRVVGMYLRGKLSTKYQLEWESVKDNPGKRKEYEEAREKIAREAFLAVRSRNGLDFADYFASTLCSVTQPLSERQYVALAQALYEDTDKVRTLTMLALSARS